MTTLPRILVPLLAVLLAAPLWAARGLMFCDMPGMAMRTHAAGDNCCAEPVAVVVETDCCVVPSSTPSSMPVPADDDVPCVRCGVAVPDAAVTPVASLAWVGIAPPVDRVADLLVISEDPHARASFPLSLPPPATLLALHAMLTC